MKQTMIVLTIITTMLFLLAGCSTINALKDKVKIPSKFEYANTYGVFFGCGNLEQMKEYIDSDKGNANKPIFDKQLGKEVSPLYLVQSDWYDSRFAEYLLEKGADPNKAYGGVTLLMCANGAPGTSCGVPTGGIGAFMSLLIKHRADVNATDKEGRSALDYAVGMGITDSVSTLLSNGSKISEYTLDAMNKEKTHMARENIYIVPRLIYQAATKQKVGFAKYSLLGEAALGNTAQVVDLLKKQGNKYDPLVPFYAAAWCGPEALGSMEKTGLSLDAKDPQGNSLLWAAASTGNLDMVKYLVENGASLDFSAYDPLYPDPLKIAVINNHYNVAEYLLSKGAMFNIDSKLGYDGADGDSGAIPMMAGDCLQGAAANGNIKMIGLLKKYGYPLDENTYYRAMKIAIDHNQVEALQYFLDKGADPNYIDNRFSDNFSLLDICAQYGTEASAQMLDRYGATIRTSKSTALADAVDVGNYPVAKYLLEHGMGIEAHVVYSDGSVSDTPWEAASSHGYFDMVKLLVEHGAKMGGKQFLNYITEGSSRILQYIVDRGADVNLQAADGTTALMYAASMHRDKNVGILLKAGADTGIKNKKGQTALDIAKADKQPDKAIIKMLEQKGK